MADLANQILVLQRHQGDVKQFHRKHGIMSDTVTTGTGVLTALPEYGDRLGLMDNLPQSSSFAPFPIQNVQNFQFPSNTENDSRFYNAIASGLSPN